MTVSPFAPAPADDTDPVREHLLGGQSVRDLATDTEPEERRLPGRRCRVYLEDGDPFEVRIDNRDYLRWDKTAPRQKWGSGRDVPFLMATFLAWSAATRAGLTHLKWEQFSDAALEVEQVEEDDEDTARPTR